MDLESSLIRVPFESLKRTTRERKYVIDDVEAVQRGVAALAAGAPPREQAVQQLEAYVQQLQSLKRKLEATGAVEQAEVARCHARLDHLRDLGPPPTEGHIEWSRKRIDRLLVDHLLRSDHQRLAAALTAKAGIRDLVDAHIYEGAQAVVEALRRRDARPALAWCDAHRGRLRKARSGLEFHLRMQEFVELVRGGRMLEAIAYARAHLAPWAGQHMQRLQHVTALLAFTAATSCPRYAPLLEEARWGELVGLFHQELHRLNLLPPTSLLSIHLQAGLCALKTPQSLGDDCSKEDPLHLPAFRALATGLPFAKHAHSKLICAISRAPMDGDNPPMALPNGYVYSQAALQASPLALAFQSQRALLVAAWPGGCVLALCDRSRQRWAWQLGAVADRRGVATAAMPIGGKLKLKGGLVLTSHGVEKLKKKKKKKEDTRTEEEKKAEEELKKAQAISVQGGGTYEQEFSLEMEKAKAGKVKNTPWGSTFKQARCAEAPEILHGYTKKVKGKTASERLDMRAAMKSDKFAR
eukprot:scaffold1.g5679.t1